MFSWLISFHISNNFSAFFKFLYLNSELRFYLYIFPWLYRLLLNALNSTICWSLPNHILARIFWATLLPINSCTNGLLKHLVWLIISPNIWYSKYSKLSFWSFSTKFISQSFPSQYIATSLLIIQASLKCWTSHTMSVLPVTCIQKSGHLLHGDNLA